jgi:septin 7
MYSWGFLDMENEEYNDFLRLRKLLIHCYLDELIYTTDTMFYNEYRKIHMRREGSDDLLRKSRLLKMKGEMERILKERNRRRVEKLRQDGEKLELYLKERMEQLEKERIMMSAGNSQ